MLQQFGHEAHLRCPPLSLRDLIFITTTEAIDFFSLIVVWSSVYLNYRHMNFLSVATR